MGRAGRATHVTAGLDLIMNINPKKMVASGYDQIALRGDHGLSGVRAEERHRYTAYLLERLSTGSEVLELGCGAGRHTTRKLAECFSVTAVDISSRQISLARANVPKAQCIQADMAMLEFLPGSFDAVAASIRLSACLGENTPPCCNE